MATSDPAVPHPSTNASVPTEAERAGENQPEGCSRDKGRGASCPDTWILARAGGCLGVSDGARRGSCRCALAASPQAPPPNPSWAFLAWTPPWRSRGQGRGRGMLAAWWGSLQFPDSSPPAPASQGSLQPRAELGGGPVLQAARGDGVGRVVSASRGGGRGEEVSGSGRGSGVQPQSSCCLSLPSGRAVDGQACWRPGALPHADGQGLLGATWSWSAVVSLSAFPP